MINLKATKKTPTINVKVDPVTHISVASSVPHTVLSDGSSIQQQIQPTPVQETTATDTTVEDVEKEQLKRHIEVLKIIIDILHSNPLVVNKYIIADDELLVRMIALLCNASEVNLDADDLGKGCLTKNVYRKINSIYVVVNGETLNMKYDCPTVMKTLKDLHISTKYVF
jgi:hypothetical protein